MSSCHSSSVYNNKLIIAYYYYIYCSIVSGPTRRLAVYISYNVIIILYTTHIYYYYIILAYRKNKPEHCRRRRHRETRSQYYACYTNNFYRVYHIIYVSLLSLSLLLFSFGHVFIHCVPTLEDARQIEYTCDGYRRYTLLQRGRCGTIVKNNIALNDGIISPLD